MTEKMPSILATGLRRIGYEIRGYAKSPEALFFNFFFPIVLFLILVLAFGDTAMEVPGVSYKLSSADVLLPGMLAMGVFVSGAQNLGIDIAHERHNGTLKRLSLTPLSPISYFIGKFGLVLIAGAIQAAAILALAIPILGAHSPERWDVFIAVWLLGLTASAILGIALSALPRSAKSTVSVILPPLLILQFISGVYLQFEALPSWMQTTASVFPLKWMAQGFRSVFYPDQLKSVEMGGMWHLDYVCLALAAWAILGLILASRTFKWIRRS